MYSSQFVLSSTGQEFQPLDYSRQFIAETSVQKLLFCVAACNRNPSCHAFDYDSSSFTCRLFEGDLTTGSLIPSTSPSVVTGYTILSPTLFSSIHDQACSACEGDRYEICSANTNTCQCPPNTYWDGGICKLQLFESANCTQIDACRADLNLTCSTYSPATTNLDCRAKCMNTTASLTLAFYSFDSVTTDATGNYPAVGISSPTYATGWVGSSISFTASSAQNLSAGNIPLNSRSFTIEFWFYATDVSSWDYAFMGQYQASATAECLFLNIRGQTLVFGFFNDDLGGATTINTNQWYHAAFVYDQTLMKKHIYLNGVLDGESVDFTSLLAEFVPFTIGGAEIGGSTDAYVYYSGRIDHLTIYSAAKNATEIYRDANLACYFQFDCISSLVDSGPNFLTATNIEGTLTAGRVNQAIQLSSPLSYIKVDGISALLYNYRGFTISMWINPTNISGGATLIHASTQPNGQGTCIIMWGLTSNGIVSVNVIDGSNTIISTTASSSLTLNTWTHVAQTFSSTNGSSLYINGVLVNTTSSSTGRPIGPYVMIGASSVNTSSCSAGSAVAGQFHGSVDEFQVFGVELQPADISLLANP